MFGLFRRSYSTIFSARIKEIENNTFQVFLRNKSKENVFMYDINLKGKIDIYNTPTKLIFQTGVRYNFNIFKINMRSETEVQIGTIELETLHHELFSNGYEIKKIIGKIPILIKYSTPEKEDKIEIIKINMKRKITS